MSLELTQNEQKNFLALARESIHARLHQRQPKAIALGNMGREKLGVFVSLHLARGKHERSLRGCIGRIKGTEELALSIPAMANAAAFEDPRFPPVKLEELEELDIELSILSAFEECSINDISPGLHGVYFVHLRGNAIFLPQVATEQGWGKEELLEQLSRKAGLHSRAYMDTGARLFRFTALVFGEKGLGR
ncbi:hypothetical protein MASR2M29_13820 [Spirochaetota bacterium]